MDYNTRILLGLTAKSFIPDDNWLSESIIKGVNSYIIHGKWHNPVTTCRHCQANSIVKNGFYTIKLKINDHNYRPTYLNVKCSRFKCKTCGKTTSSHCDLKERHCHLSKEVKQRILLELTKNVSRKHIAEQFGVSDMTVLRIMKSLSESYTKRKYDNLPTILCIDEFKSTKYCSGSMSFICVNGETNKIFDILEDRRVSHLIDYFMKFDREERAKVQCVVMDMNSNYGKFIRLVFPNALIITDRFHIIQHMNRNFSILRVKEMNTLKKGNNSEQMKQYRRLKKYWKLLLKDSFELNSSNYTYNYLFKDLMSESTIVDKLLSYSEVLKEAYEFIQLLKYSYSERDTNFFFDTLANIPKTLPDYFKSKFKVFSRYKTEIMNAFNTTLSNGITEGYNNKIKVIKRVAYGYKSFNNFRLRILFIQGYFFTVLKHSKKTEVG